VRLIVIDAALGNQPLNVVITVLINLLEASVSHQVKPCFVRPHSSLEGLYHDALAFASAMVMFPDSGMERPSGRANVGLLKYDVPLNGALW
jgi:hypothetical protein